MAKWRDRKFRLLLYPEDPSHSVAIKELERGGYQFAAILHDQDTWDEDDEDLGSHTPGEKKKEHWHVVVKFPQPRYSTGLASSLGLKENYIKECVAFEPAMKYLVHEGWPDKFQYDPEKVFGTLKPALMKLLADKKDEGARIKEILNIVDSFEGKITIRAALKIMADNDLYGDFRRMGILAKMLLDEHNADIIECDRIVQMRKTEFDEFREFIKWRERAESAGYANKI